MYFSNELKYSLLFVFAASFIICFLLLITKRWHGVFTLDEHTGIQKFHSLPTPRVGGIPIFLSLFFLSFYLPSEQKEFIFKILSAGLPAFLFGLAEDLTKRVGVTSRLAATIGSGFLAYLLFGLSISRVDLIGFDSILNITLISVIFTCFAVGGLANSINIIDGFNGLSSSASIYAFIGFALISMQTGDILLVSISLIFAASVLGFFCINWPFGKLFLGDGGSYFIGFSLAWIAILLIERNPSVSAFAVLIVCSHPIIEVLFSIFRRKIKKMHPGHPDRLHLHSLLNKRYITRWFPKLKSDLKNSLTGLIVGAMTLIAALTASFVYSSRPLSFLIAISFFLGYVSIYARMVRFHWCSPIKFMFSKPTNNFKIKDHLNV